jgi:hypothetical protein
MAEIVEYPLAGNGVLKVQAAEVDLERGELTLASPDGQAQVKRAKETLDSALAQVTPALESFAGQLQALSPDEVTVEFGLTLTAEAGIVVAKGTAEVHFTVTLSWSKDSDRTEEHRSAPGNDREPSARRSEVSTD